jgi:hypothetical protein
MVNYISFYEFLLTLLVSVRDSWRVFSETGSIFASQNPAEIAGVNSQGRLQKCCGEPAA